jgi:sulfur carrier protein ThiS
MPVQVMLVGILRLSPAGSDAVREVEAGRTVRQILSDLEIRPDLVAMVLLNGRQATKDAVAHDGDVVKLVPFVGGG